MITMLYIDEFLSSESVIGFKGGGIGVEMLTAALSHGAMPDLADSPLCVVIVRWNAPTMHPSCTVFFEIGDILL
jgi:hypothetical protein